MTIDKITEIIRKSVDDPQQAAELAQSVDLVVRDQPHADVYHVITMTVSRWREQQDPARTARVRAQVARDYSRLTGDEALALAEDFGDYSHYFAG